jgi:hypothetical protein
LDRLAIAFRAGGRFYIQRVQRHVATHDRTVPDTLTLAGLCAGCEHFGFCSRNGESRLKVDSTMPNFPEGKLRIDDEGALDVIVGVEGDAVFIGFRKPVLWVALEPEYVDNLIASLEKHKQIVLAKRQERAVS